MDRTIKVCDRCPEPRRPAVTVLSLSNGRATKHAPTVEVCAEHARQISHMFKPRGAGGMPTHHKKSARFQKMWGPREKHVLDVLTKAKEPIPPTELRKLVKFAPTIRAMTLRRLMQQRKIKRTGWSKGTRWSLI